MPRSQTRPGRRSQIGADRSHPHFSAHHKRFAVNSIRLSCSLALVAFTTFGASSAHAGTLYVNANASTGANDGSSWSDAFQGSGGLQSALAIAASGDQIWVAQGTYLPTSNGDRSVSFQLKTDVAIYGGFAGGETSLAQRDPVAHVTSLSGDLNGDDANNHFGDNSYHVVFASGATSSAVLDGFTVSGGNANVNGDYHERGGGICLLSGSDVTIARCRVLDNRSSSNGGGVYVESNASFIDSRFEGNVSDLGGGLAVLSPSDQIVSRCVFIGNAAARGGGIDAGLGGSPTVTNCLFYGNTATGYEGGAAMNISSPAIRVVNCTVVGNHDASAGGGAAVVNVIGSGSSIANSILYSNKGSIGSQPSAVQVQCSSVAWCCVQGGHAGAGNIDKDPQLHDVVGGDLTLAPTSPCIDAGNNTLVPPGTTLDLDLQPRFVDDPSVPDTGLGNAPIVDIGAYEAPNHLYSSFCAGDAKLATACPCGNFGQSGHGCANSDTLTAGAWQAAAGTVSPDTVVLTASEMLPSVLCVFLQGDAQNPNGVVFGDGVRCVAGRLLRLAAKHSVSDVASYPEPGDLSITARSAQLGQPISSGDVRYYQTYYRDPNLDFCPPPQGNSWNVSNAIAVQW
jgi:hypothetical protein